jgi:hypothetical protein
MEIKNRHIELSAKFMEMGKALIEEGHTDKDTIVVQTGNFMVLLGNILLDPKDVVLFGELCSMFSAKKILESMEESKGVKPQETYEEFIERINKIRKDNGLEPIG